MDGKKSIKNTQTPISCTIVAWNQLVGYYWHYCIKTMDNSVETIQGPLALIIRTIGCPASHSFL